MPTNQDEIPCGEPMNMGIFIFSPISSTAGSPSLSLIQPILTGKVFASALVLIGAEFFLFIIGHIFKHKSIPILDVNMGNTVQIPLSELQEFLRWMSNSSLTKTFNQTNISSAISSPGGFDPSVINRGFPVKQTPEAPLTISIYVTSAYSNKAYSPDVWLIIPLFTFPGLRGSIPILILSLIATILVRAVVTPESSGSKPLIKSDAEPNAPLNFTSNDIITLLTRFGKHFSFK